MSTMSASDLHPLIYDFLKSSGHEKTAKTFAKEVKKSHDEMQNSLKEHTATIVDIYQHHKKTTPAKAAPKKEADSSSSDSSSDSDSEDEAPAPVKAAPVKAADSSSSSSSDSDSEDEAPVKPAVPAKAAPAKAAADSSSSSSSDSDSEDEAPAKAAVPVKAAAPAKAAVDSSSSSSSDSDSDSEDEAPAKVAAPAKAAAKSDSSSSSSSDSDSDDEVVVNNKRKREEDGASTPAAKKAATGGSAEGKVVRVSGMPYEVTEDEIKAFFKDCNITGIDMPTWPDSGRSKGYANLTMATDDDAAKCIAMNGATMGTRWLKIEAHNGQTPHKPTQPGEKPEGCTRVFIGNLSYDIDEATLRAALKDCGEIARLKWGEDRETGDFKGYAHVDFADTNDTDKAVALNGEMCCGRAMKIDYAQNSGNNASPRAKGGKGAQIQPMCEKPEGCCTLFIANLSFNVTEDLLWEEFGKCGDVKAIRLATDRETGEYRGFGHLEFYDTASADNAAKLLGKDICGRPLRMDWAKPREPKK